MSFVTEFTFKISDTQHFNKQGMLKVYFKNFIVSSSWTLTQMVESTNFNIIYLYRLFISQSD